MSWVTSCGASGSRRSGRSRTSPKRPGSRCRTSRSWSAAARRPRPRSSRPPRTRSGWASPICSPCRTAA
uniref:Putative DNA-binding protein n=1 Tax=uncultured bacterium 8 TaxID=1136413 RepID=H9CXZ4_9BACT|nr:putative DNA-binding protein [uncultured bacterium 8]